MCKLLSLAHRQLHVQLRLCGYTFIVHYGLLEKILTDQGHNFESDLLKALCEIAQVKKNLDIRISSADQWSMQTF